MTLIATIILLAIAIYCACSWVAGFVATMRLNSKVWRTNFAIGDLDRYRALDRNMFHHGLCAILALGLAGIINAI